MAKSDQETTCLWVQGVIDSYIDKELAGVESSRLESHLAECSACAEELALARRVKSTLRTLPQQHCPDRVVAAALDQVESKAGPTKKYHPWAWVARWYGRRWQLAAVTAMFLTVLIAGLILMRPQRPTTTVSPEELARAEQQVKWTLAYVGHVGQRSASIVYEEVIESELEPLVKKGLGQIQETKAKLFRNLNS